MSDKKYFIKNRSAGMVGYVVPELNIRRELYPGEQIEVTYDELEKLSYQPGGKHLVTNYLQIKSADVVQNLGLKVEPEYNMSEQDVVDLIKTGSLDAFLDCLDFAPDGVIDLIKRFSVEIPMTDLNKCKALLDKTGFDTAKAVANLQAEKMEENKQEEKEPVRRVQPGRRTTSKYAVVDDTVKA